MRAEVVTQQFVTLLQSVRLPHGWQQRFDLRCRELVEALDSGDAQTRREGLEDEQRRLINAYRKGYINDQQLDDAIAEIRSELADIPMAPVQDYEDFHQRAIEVAQILDNLASYWRSASAHEQRHVVAALLRSGGIIYDLQRQLIIGMRPKSEALPVFELALAAEWWYQGAGAGDGEDDVLWLKPECYDRYARRSASEADEYQPAERGSLTQKQQETAQALLQTGQSLQQVADQVGCSYWAILRLAQRYADPDSVRSAQQRPKLSDTQQAEVLELLATGMSLRAVAKQFGVSYASIDRIKQRQRHN